MDRCTRKVTDRVFAVTILNSADFCSEAFGLLMGQFLKAFLQTGHKNGGMTGAWIPHWSPCQVGGGRIGSRQALRILGAEQTECDGLIRSPKVLNHSSWNVIQWIICKYNISKCRISPFQTETGYPVQTQRSYRSKGARCCDVGPQVGVHWGPAEP